MGLQIGPPDFIEGNEGFGCFPSVSPEAFEGRMRRRRMVIIVAECRLRRRRMAIVAAEGRLRRRRSSTTRPLTRYAPSNTLRTLCAPQAHAIVRRVTPSGFDI